MSLIDRDKIEYQYLPISAIGSAFVTKTKVDQMPSVETPHWVSIEERLPKKRGKYICYESSPMNPFYTIDAILFSEDLSRISGVNFPSKPGFYYYDYDLGRYTIPTDVMYWLEGLELPESKEYCGA